VRGGDGSAADTFVFMSDSSLVTAVPSRHNG